MYSHSNRIFTAFVSIINKHYHHIVPTWNERKMDSIIFKIYALKVRLGVEFGDCPVLCNANVDHLFNCHLLAAGVEIYLT